MRGGASTGRAHACPGWSRTLPEGRVEELCVAPAGQASCEKERPAAAATSGEAGQGSPRERWARDRVEASLAWLNISQQELVLQPPAGPSIAALAGPSNYLVRHV